MAKKKIKKPEKKNKGGRPSKFPEIMLNIAGIQKALQMGHTEKDTCEMFNISVPTFEKYKKESKEFFKSIRQGKIDADEKVVNSLFKRAVGYEVEEKHYEGQRLKKRIKKEMAPDTHAGIFWLKNRMPKVWKDKHDIDLSNPDGSLSPDNIIINLVPTMPKGALKQ